MTALRAELDSFWTRELDQLVRDALATAGGSVMPFEKSVLVPLRADETFAQATGQQATVPGGLAAHVLDVAGQVSTPEVRSGGGFADAVPVGPDAYVTDRLIVFTGRSLGGHTA